MVRLKNVSKSFDDKGKSTHAVRDVSLTIEDGEIFGIIGFSGAGKSTLVRCINLLEKPSHGTVEVDGEEITALSTKELRRARKKMGMIFQQFNLMPSRTVFDNIAYPLKGSGLNSLQIKERVLELLKLVDIPDKEEVYPSQLSGGQKQRVAIARALANNPRILLCDEATSALDPQTTQSILKLLKQLNEQLNITIIVITHEMAVVKEICSRVAVMEQGWVVEEGDIFSVFSKPKQEVTRNFIYSTSNLQKIDAMIESKSQLTYLQQGEVIVRMSYVQKNTSQPLISEVSQKFGISLNVIFADIEIVDDSPIGGTVAIISGDSQQIVKAMAYLNEKNVEVEVLKDVRNTDKSDTKCNQ